jgi:curved DNA-binding protein CbpA
MISNRDDPHAVLGVARTATPTEISHAYRDLLRRHHPDTRTPDDDHTHDVALSEVLNAYADLHDRARRGADDHDQQVRHPSQPEDPRTQPIVVLGHVDPPITATPAWIGHYGNEVARPTPIHLLIAFLQALPSEPS